MRPSWWRQVRACAFTLLFAAATGATADAQGAETVPPSSDVYRRIEAITAFFPVPVHLGLRPASRRSLGGTIDKLGAALNGAPLDHPRRRWALRELAAIREEIGIADSTRALRHGWRLDAYSSNAVFARVDSNGLGALDAFDGPFSRDRRGLASPNGASVTLLPVVVAAGRRVAIVAEPAVGYYGDASGMHGSLRVHRAYARLVVTNVALQAGSDDRRWGQSVHGPLFMSGNAAPIPALSLGTDTAIVLPWLFRLAGPVQGTLFVGDLGPTQDPPHARLAGWQVNIQPWSRFELGVAVLVHTGGNGGPGATFLERVIDLFPAIDALAPQHADLQFSNKIAGGNLRIRFPELSGLDVYYELAIDDFDGRRLISSMVDDAGHLLGARMAAGPAVVRGEWHYTSLRLYEHAQFRSGMTYRQRLIGNPLGPHARAGYVGVEWPLRGDVTASLVVADERRDPSQYTVTVSGARDRGFEFIRLTDDPDVRRAQVTGSLDGSLGRFAGRVTYGLARSWRTGGDARLEWVSRVELRSRILPWF